MRNGPRFYCLSLIYIDFFAWINKQFQQKNTLKSPYPVIIVGNITVGGTGKTPIVIWLAQELCKRGYKPGVISRGYGGRCSTHKPYAVLPHSSPLDAGDEPLLIAKRTLLPVVICQKRSSALEFLLEHHEVNIVISDDGLQNYTIPHDVEIVIMDDQRRLGNGCCLPAGPLREPKKRLQTVDALWINGSSKEDEANFQLAMQDLVALVDKKIQPLASFKGQTVHAVAGIGNPLRFFSQLQAQGIKVIPHAFPDHYAYKPEDFLFSDDYPIVMTEKDAIKCETFLLSNAWFVPVTVIPSPNLLKGLATLYPMLSLSL